MKNKEREKTNRSATLEGIDKRDEIMKIFEAREGNCKGKRIDNRRH